MISAFTAMLVAFSLVALAGCGDGEEDAFAPLPQSGFAEALGEVSTGPIPIGVGFGYIDLAALGGADADRVAGALGPGGSILLTESRAIARDTGFDPASADRLLSVAASYTLGVRADGVEQRLALGARDPVTDAPIRSSFSEASFDRLEGQGADAARATLTLAEGEKPGVLFRAFVHGSVITYLGLADPHPE